MVARLDISVRRVRRVRLNLDNSWIVEATIFRCSSLQLDQR